MRSLGKSLKGLLQIEFVDEHGVPERGIDGGGLFKEFLTLLSVAAYNPDFGLFSETEDHYLYPNPGSDIHESMLYIHMLYMYCLCIVCVLYMFYICFMFYICYIYVHVLYILYVCYICFIYRYVMYCLDHLDLFKFLGQILGKAMYDGVLIEPQFANFFLLRLLGVHNYGVFYIYMFYIYMFYIYICLMYIYRYLCYICVS